MNQARFNLLIMAMADLSDQHTAPTRRMKAMISGFQQCGISITVISGSRAQRSRSARQLIKSESRNEIQGIYVESSNSGMLYNEYRLLNKLRKTGIPTAVYIRDAYPYFKEFWNLRSPKLTISFILWYLSVKSWQQLSDIGYFPSSGLMKYFSFKRQELLIPAKTELETKSKRFCAKTIFYCGGIASRQYDVETFLEACRKVSAEIELSVIIYCRESERYLLQKWLDESWLMVQHKQLEEIDFLPAISIIPLSRHPYSELAFPVKLMDYIALESVIVTSDSHTASSYVQKNKLGLTVEAGKPASYIKAIKLLLTNEAEYDNYRSNVKRLNASKEITWKSRCIQVLNDLGLEINQK